MKSEKPGLSVLLVEDDTYVRRGCRQAMQLAGIPVETVTSAEDAQRRLQTDCPGVVVSDLRLPRMDGMGLLRWVYQLDPDLPVIIITGHGEITLAVEAMRCGAYDFMEKPFSTSVLVDVVRRALEKRALVLEVESLRRRLDYRDDLEGRLIGRSPQMAKVRKLILDVADEAINVLIMGETGTGKELVAQCLHDFSSARQQKFVALNCGGMADSLLDSELFGHVSGAFTGAQRPRTGKFEYVNGGTLFLDEVETMSMHMQIKLLRVLENKVIERLGSNDPISVPCRVVAAAKEDLKGLSREGKFRLDLYFRLSGVRIELPALRERREDIPELYDKFLLQAAKCHNRPLPPLTPESLRQLMAMDWPGNVRELRNAANCHVLGIAYETLTAGKDGTPLSLAEDVDNYERLRISIEFAKQDGNIGRTAEALQVARTTLHDKLKKYGLI